MPPACAMDPVPVELHVVVIGGSSDRAALILRPGEPQGPLGVGRQGDWRIEAQGVGAVHVYLFFDGQSLHASNADRTTPTLVQGRPIDAAWTRVDPPAEIVLAGARLRVMRAPAHVVESSMTTAPAVGLPAPDASPPPSPRARPTWDERPVVAPHRDDETTRLDPIDVPTPPGVPPVQPGAAPRAPAPVAPRKVGALRAAWGESSWVQKAILLLMPFAVVATFVVFDDDPAPTPRRARPAASAAVAASVATPGASATAAAAPPAAPVVPSAPSAAAPARDARDKRTDERAAADAVAAGAWGEAARLYDALAAAHPESRALREAARIAHLRAAGVER